MPTRQPPAIVRDFVPPHCPHRECAAHVRGPHEAFRFHRWGFQRIERDPGWVLILQSWLNNAKRISERSASRSRTTPAMLLGLAEAPLDPKQLFARRLFPRREQLPPSMVELYEGRIKARPREQISVAEPVFAH